MSSSDAQIVTLFFSSIAPVLPLFLNSKTTWTEDKTSALLSHVLGQSAVLGTSEFIRHFSVVVDNTFQQKCNLSVEMCKAWTATMLPLVNQNNKSGLCKINETDTLEIRALHDSLHSMPNSVLAMVGSSVVVFFANLFLWTRYNKNNKNVSSANVFVKLIMIVGFLIFITFAVVYRFKEKLQSVTDLSLSFFFGIIIQIVMTLLYQVKKRTHQELMLAEATAKNVPPSPIMRCLSNEIEMKECTTPLKQK